jgi:cytochrome c553
MKRAVVLGAVVAAAGVAALGGVVGPDLLAAYRFEKALDRHAGDYQTNGGSWPQLQDTCALCHGPRGQSKNAQYASLAGLSASYIESQLRAFAEGRRRNP